jgi:hypothetical protein
MRGYLPLVLALLVIVSVAGSPVYGKDFNAVKIKVYNSDTNHVYFEKIVPKDQKFHTVVNTEDVSIDLTYDPSATGVDRSLSCSDGVCTDTVTLGKPGDTPRCACFNGICTCAIPVTANFSSGTAPIPNGVYAILVALLAGLVLKDRI